MRQIVFVLNEEYDTGAGPTALRSVAVFRTCDLARHAMVRRVAADTASMSSSDRRKLIEHGDEFATFDSPDRVRYAIRVGDHRRTYGYAITTCMLDPEEA